jgi:predicted kinase
LPGTGKSTLSRALADSVGFTVVRSDVVRKELAGSTREDIYTPEWTERTYRECLGRAAALLFEGKRVLVDATFREERHRRLFLDAALASGVPGLFLRCRADEAVCRRRIEQRRGDASDADWQVYLQLADAWEEAGERTRAAACDIDTGSDGGGAVAAALDLLRRHDLV